MNGPWLDMSAYPNLPPDDAVDGRALDALHAVLRAPEITPPPPDVWERAVHDALVRGHATVDRDAAWRGAEHHAAGVTGQESAGDQPGHEDHGHQQFGPGHEDGQGTGDDRDWAAGWPGGHGSVGGGEGTAGSGPDLEDPHTGHDSDGGGHW